MGLVADLERENADLKRRVADLEKAFDGLYELLDWRSRAASRQRALTRRRNKKVSLAAVK